MSMRQEHMVNLGQLINRQREYAGTGIDQDILIQQPRRGVLELATDTTATTEDANFQFLFGQESSDAIPEGLRRIFAQSNNPFGVDII